MPTPRSLKIMQERHKILHKCFDELLACFINEHDGKLLNTSLEEFMKWSHAMTLEPTCAGAHDTTADDVADVPPRSGL